MSAYGTQTPTEILSYILQIPLTIPSFLCKYLKCFLQINSYLTDEIQMIIMWSISKVHKNPGGLSGAALSP